MTPADPQAPARARAVTEVPLLRFLGVTYDGDLASPVVTLPWNDAALNAADALHGGTVTTILDVAAYLAVLPELAPDEEAVTHALSASYVAAARPGDQLRATGALVRRGRRVAFATAELRSATALVAMATVTKSIVSR